MINDRVNFSKRDKKWIEEQIVQIAKNSPTTQESIRESTTFWDYYNNKPNDKKHDFLRKAGENMELPVYYYHIPIQRTMIDSLVSQQANRPFNFSITMCDKTSLEEKYANQLKEYIQFALENAEKKTEMLTEIAGNIQEQVGQMEQMLQEGSQQIQQAQEQGQEVHPEQMQQLQQLEQQLPLIKKQAEQQLKAIEKQSIITADEIDRIKKHQLMSYKDIKEIIAQKTLVKLIQELRIDSKITKAFLSKVVVGKSRYFVYYDGKTVLPQFDVLDAINVTYPLVDGVEDISKGKWVKIRTQMSVHHVLNNWGKEIEKKYGVKAIDDLTVFGSYNYQKESFISTPMNGAIFIDDINSPMAGNESISVDRVFFKANRKQIVKYSPNVNSDKDSDVFRHFVDPNKEIIKKEDYKYKVVTDENGIKKSYYINKKNEKLIFKEDEVELYSESKKESYTEVYTTDIYEGVIINNLYIVALKLHEYTVKNVDRYADKNLPVFGRTNISVTDQPYSLIGATIDLQDLYDVVYMQQQLMIALSGTKGNIIDRSQKPQGMSDEEWEYNMKMGRLYIQTKDKNGNNINPSFNQWSSYDNTLSPSIQYFGMILDRLEGTMGNVIGMSPQRRGKVVPSDQVATFEMAIQQNELVTEIIYYDHDIEASNALAELLHLALRYCYINNDILDLQSKEMGSEIFMIPANLLNNVQWRLNVMNNVKDEKTLKDIRGLLMNSWTKGQTSLSQLTDSMTEDSITELKVKIKYWEDRASQLNAQSMQAEKEGNLEVEKAKAQYKAEFDNEWKMQTLKIQEQLAGLESKRIEYDGQLKERDLAIKEKVANDANKLKLLELLNEQSSETGVLAENKEARINSQKLEAIQIQLNAMMQGMNMNLQLDKNNKDHTANMEKIKVDKAKKINKEHVID
jgi:hypothetical protein